ncbi:MAG: hypothetical protein KO202_02850 [Methanobacteriaceae archaeon]|jgi:hypothetical protein|nr:hypothetical protein [Methanobacteriaceae archaeon]
MDTETLIILINIAMIGIIASVIVKLYYRDEESKEKQKKNKYGNSQNSQLENLLSSIGNIFNQTKKRIQGNNKKNKLHRTTKAYDYVAPYFKDENPEMKDNYDKVYQEPISTQEYKSWEEPRKDVKNNENIASKVFQEPIESKHKKILEKTLSKEEFIKDEPTQNIEETIQQEQTIQKPQETRHNTINEAISDISSGSQLKMDNNLTTIEDINIPLKDRVKEKKLKEENISVDNDKMYKSPEDENKIDKAQDNQLSEDEDLKDLFTIDELIKKSKEEDNIKNDENIKVKNFDENESIIKVDNNELKNEDLHNIKETPKEEEYPKIKDIINTDEYLDDETSFSNEGYNLLEKENNSLKKPSHQKSLFDENEFDFVNFEEIKDNIKNSKIITNVKKFAEDTLEELQTHDSEPDDDFIRNVKTYDIEEPPKNVEDKLREENTKKIYNMAQNKNVIHHDDPKTIPQKSITPKTSEKPQDAIEVKINNNQEVVKKGDSIIFTYNGESYSSRLINIYGNDIEVKYRGRTVLINPNDIKKKF